MATLTFTGAALAVSQVDTLTVGGTIEATDIFNITITSEFGTAYTLAVVAGSTDKDTVIATLVAAFNACTHPNFTGITAADTTSTLTGTMTLTADVAGVPFTCTETTTETGGGAQDDQTFEVAHTTASSGPKDWNCVENWSGGALPGGGADEEVFIPAAAGDILYNLDQSAIANTLSRFIKYAGPGKIGPENADGEAGVSLQIKATIIDINKSFGPSAPSVSGRVKINAGDVASTITVYNSGISADTGKPAVRLLANSASTDIYVKKGSVGIATEPGETTTINDLYIDYVSSIAGDADVFVGSGVTLGDVIKTGGDLVIESAAANITSDAGTVQTEGSNNISGALSINGGLAKLNSTGTIATLNTKGTLTANKNGVITTANVKGGNAVFNSSATISALNMSGGVTDTTKSKVARTITTPKIGAGATFKFDPAIVTLTNPIEPLDTDEGAIAISSAAA